MPPACYIAAPLLTLMGAWIALAPQRMGLGMDRAIVGISAAREVREHMAFEGHSDRISPRRLNAGRRVNMDGNDADIRNGAHLTSLLTASVAIESIPDKVRPC